MKNVKNLHIPAESAIEDQIRYIYSNNIQNMDDLGLITKYNDLYNEISGSSNYVIDLGVLIRFASSISVPLIYILTKDPNIIHSIFNIFVRYLIL